MHSTLEAARIVQARSFTSRSEAGLQHDSPAGEWSIARFQTTDVMVVTRTDYGAYTVQVTPFYGVFNCLGLEGCSSVLVPSEAAAVIA